MSTSSIHAATIDWDGTTGSVNTDTGGNTSVQDNWGPSGGGAGTPGVFPTSADRARFLDVTSGTRAVIVDTATSWLGLDMTQSSADGVNSLQLGADLTLGDSTGFSVTAISMDASAGDSTMVIDLNGHAIQANGDYFLNVNLDGNILMGSGSTLQINQYSSQGQQILSNAGILSMDAAHVIYDWTALTNNNGVRKFNNSGEWTMENGSALTFTSSAGRPLAGFGNMQNNTNSGTLRVLSNSTMQFESIINTGTLELGSGSIVSLQDPSSYSSTTSINNSTDGIVTISGNSTLGSAVEGGSVAVNNGVSGSTGGLITVGNGVDPTTWDIVEGKGITVNNNTGNTLTVNSGSTLLLRTFDDGSPHSYNYRPTKLNNTGGTVNLVGRISFQPNHAPPGELPERVVVNTGVFNVSGNTPSIERNANTATVYFQTEFQNNSGGSLQGDGVLSYVNSTTRTDRNIETMLVSNSGAIEPGNGSNGSGLTSVGDLTLANTNVVFASGGTMLFDIGGDSSSGFFDTLTINGTGGGIDLTAGGGSISFNVVNSYTPTGNMSWQILNASVTGTFDTVNLPSSALGTWSFNQSTGVLSVVVGATGYTAWADGTFSPPLTAKLPGDNQDNDALNNLQEFAFGTQPTVSTGEINYTGGTLNSPGAPKIVAAGGTYSMVFGRRSDYVAAGLTYTVEFTSDLVSWVANDDGTNPPVEIATNGTINAMSVPYPDSITTQSGTSIPKFSRVRVVLAP